MNEMLYVIYIYIFIYRREDDAVNVRELDNMIRAQNMSIYDVLKKFIRQS